MGKSLLRVIRRDLDLDVHVRVRERSHSNLRPDGPVVRDVLLEQLRHDGGDLESRLAQVVGVDAEDLRPALAAGVLERCLDVLEGLLVFGLEVFLDMGLVVADVPTSCIACQVCTR